MARCRIRRHFRHYYSVKSAIDETKIKPVDQPSLAPALPPELRHSRELETSEEVRVKLLKMLRVVLILQIGRADV